MRKRIRSTSAGQICYQAFECGVDVRGRITLPKAVREHMHVKPGDRIKFTLRPWGQRGNGSALSDHYYAELERLKGKISKDIDLEF